ncbi:HEAT repeat domain-containing protein [Streptomyces phaeochromogenes]|uniref:HEAT repeat domain-containing protein n=1 Tax=Streptomyces phaeochromogenes TaxID=1923 RepID=UPI003255A9CA
MAWWKRKDRVSESRCQVCQAKLSAGSAIPRIEQVYVTAQQTKVVRYLCTACRQRHLSLAADAEALFRRERPVEEVCAWLEDPDLDVRAEAARQLARLGDRRAVPALCNALAREASPSKAFEGAAEALGAFGGPEAEQALIAVLDDERAWSRPDYGDDYGPSRVDMAADALVTLGGSTLFVRAVLHTMMSSAVGSDLRERAAHELADIAYRSTVGYGLMPWVDE